MHIKHNIRIPYKLHLLAIKAESYHFSSISKANCYILLKMLKKYVSFAVALLLMQLAMAHEDAASYGLHINSPGASCADIYEKNPISHDRSGLYLVKTDKTFLAQCDMKFGKGWLKVADLNMARGDKCPKEWRELLVNGIRVCRSPNDNPSCYSTIFTVNNTKYQKIRGFVRGYQKRFTDSFDSRQGVRGIDETYVDGVSITLGKIRKHVWTYVAGCGDSANHSTSNCPCAPIPGPAPPAFVGEHYYCESGNNGQPSLNDFFIDDPLWDGAGCVHAKNTCCNIVGLPWFLREFATTQHEDIEVRICTDESYNNEAVLVDQLQLYVQ